MSKRTTLARTAVSTLVVLGLSSGVAVANPCETDPVFAAANDCADASVRVLASSATAVSSATAMPAGLGLRVR